jgi:hypothetical protein
VGSTRRSDAGNAPGGHSRCIGNREAYPPLRSLKAKHVPPPQRRGPNRNTDDWVIADSPAETFIWSPDGEQAARRDAMRQSEAVQHLNDCKWPRNLFVA